MKKEQLKVIGIFVLCILVILLTQFSDWTFEVKSTALFCNVGLMFGTVLNYFSKENKGD